MSLINFSFKKPTLILSINFLIILLGLSVIPMLKNQKLPAVSFPLFTIQITDPGLSAQGIKETISIPVEKSLLGIAGLENTQALSYTGVSLITAVFKMGADIDQAYRDVSQKLNSISDLIPKNASKPKIFRRRATDQPVIWVLASSDNNDFLANTHYSEEQIIPKLENIPGVASVKVGGTIPKRILVKLSQDRMSGLRIPLALVFQAFKTENVNIPGGVIDNHGKNYVLSLDMQIKSLENIKKLIVTYRDNKPIYLSRIAEIKLQDTPGLAKAYSDGKPVIAMGIIRSSNANTVDVINRVEESVKAQQSSLPTNMHLDTALSQKESINTSVDSLVEAIVYGLIFASLVVYLFLGSARLSAVIMTIVPVSLCASILALAIFNVSFNTVTLVSLILLIGIVVDDAIIVIENHIHTMEMYPNLKENIAIKSGNSIVAAIIAYTISLCAIFFAVLLVTGLLKIIFNQVSLIIIPGVIISALAALSLTPLLCDRFITSIPKPNLLSKICISFFDNCQTVYVTSLKLAFRYKYFMVILFLSLLLPISYTIKHIDINLLPADVNFERLVIDLRSNKSESSEGFIKDVLRIDKIIKSNSNVEKTIVLTGATDPNKATVYTLLKSSENRDLTSNQIKPILQNMLDNQIGINGFVLNPPMLPGGQQPMQIIIDDNNYKNLLLLENKVLPKLEKYNDIFAKVQTPNMPMQATYQLHIDRYAAAQVGLKVNDITRAVALYGGNIRVGKTILNKDDKEYSIYLYPTKNELIKPNDLSMIYLFNKNGKQISLSSVATIKVIAKPTVISTFNGKPSLYFRATPKVGLTKAIAKFKKLISPMLSPSQSIIVIGQAVQIKSSLHSFSVALLLAIVLVYFTLASQFDSFLQPFILFISQPLAIAFVIYLLYLTGVGINCFSLVGLFLLIGIKTKNFILLISAMNKEFKSCGNAVEAAISACSLRFRPIIMTSLVVVLAMLPTLFTSGEMRASNIALGITIAGGIVSSTILSLYFVPICYSFFTRKNKTES